MTDEKPTKGLAPESPLLKHDTVLLSHGSGGLLSQELTAKLFQPAFDNEYLAQLDDHARLTIGSSRLSFSTDSYVVNPLFFPGGNIGSMAVHGTVNDLSTGGARPLFLSAGFIIEEGFLMADLQRVVDSMREAALEAGVKIVTGDTKVVDRGKADKLFINTTGIGLVEHDYEIHGGNLQPGDDIIVTGSIADHGIAVLAARKELSFQTGAESDSAPLNQLTLDLVETIGTQLHAMRDPTRGGVAASLNEMAVASSVSIRLDEALIPVRPEVREAAKYSVLIPSMWPMKANCWSLLITLRQKGR
jgi:hydrogenase expression/formation protein HypE